VRVARRSAAVLPVAALLAAAATSHAGPARPPFPRPGPLPAPAPASSTPAVEMPALSGTALQSAVPVSGTVLQAAAMSGTAAGSAAGPAALSGTLVEQPALSATIQGPTVPGQERSPARPAFTRTAAGAAKPAKPPVPYEALHRRASLVMMPTAYAAHMKGPTGENAEVFLLWYIGTLYDERGLWIAPISTLFIGADLKWSFLSEKGGRPAAALGYLGGLEVPFTGGVIKVSGLAAQQQIKQSFVHDAYMVLSHQFGPLAVTGGAMYGFKKGFPVILPMLRNPNFSTKANPAPIVPWTAFGGIDLALGERHIKVEVLTLPEVTVDRPWLVNTYLGGILGFDFAYLKDRIGYEVLGYYQLPFYRWPDQKRLEKERDRMAAARRR